MFYLAFIILRLADITTTFNCLKINCSTEINPFNAFLIKSFTLNGFVLINLFLSLIVLLIFYLTKKSSISKITLYGFLILNFIIVLSNLLTQLVL